MVSAERELSIRARVAAVYNRPEADFASRGEYDDYLEKVRARRTARPQPARRAPRVSLHTRGGLGQLLQAPRSCAGVRQHLQGPGREQNKSLRNLVGSHAPPPCGPDACSGALALWCARKHCQAEDVVFALISDDPAEQREAEQKLRSYKQENREAIAIFAARKVRTTRPPRKSAETALERAALLPLAQSVPGGVGFRLPHTSAEANWLFPPCPPVKGLRRGVRCVRYLSH